MPIIKKTPQTKQDLLDQVLYLAQINPDLAERFIESAELTFKKVAQMPLKGQKIEFNAPELAEVRRWFISDFKDYLIFYRVIPDGIEVLRVLHGRQNIEAILKNQEPEQSN